mmetsp:Transcript_4962/g.11182  ORF Transcript_4962/g.11182 Transcript_4962/m.11182 type:complete len:116 (+) Transcript_4962:2204-2551(+)
MALRIEVPTSDDPSLSVRKIVAVDDFIVVVFPGHSQKTNIVPCLFLAGRGRWQEPGIYCSDCVPSELQKPLHYAYAAARIVLALSLAANLTLSPMAHPARLPNFARCQMLIAGLL